MSLPKEDYYHEEALPFHPYRILLYLLLAGITALFLATTGAYLFTRVQMHTPPLPVPMLFVINTLVLIGSSFTLNWANNCYAADETKRYQVALGATLGLTLLFMGLQYVGWEQLQPFLHAPSTDRNSVNYIYAISILHFIHIVGGLPFMLLFLATAVLRMREPVSVLVYFSDPAKLMKLRLLTTYWHYLDILWIYLVVFFLLNSLFLR